MLTAPLQLKEYFYPAISVVANPAFATADPPEPDVKVDATPDVYVSKEDENEFQVKLEVRINSTDTNPSPYDCWIVCFGYFTVDPAFTDKERLVSVNGSSMLYSATREMVALISGRGPLKHFILPAVNFNAPPQKEEGGQQKTRKKKSESR